MVSHDKEYEFVTSQIVCHIERAHDAIKLFVQLYSAVVAGSVWLSLQGKMPLNAVPRIATLADALVALITLYAVVIIVLNYNAWWGYRRAQSKLVPHVPPPKRSGTLPGWLMGMSAVVACMLFWKFNPFVLISN